MFERWQRQINYHLSNFMEPFRDPRRPTMEDQIDRTGAPKAHKKPTTTEQTDMFWGQYVRVVGFGFRSRTIIERIQWLRDNNRINEADLLEKALRKKNQSSS